MKPKKLDSVITQAIDRFRNARKGERGRTADSVISVATVNKELRHLRAVFKIAEEWGMLQRAPKVTMLREPRARPTVR